MGRTKMFADYGVLQDMTELVEEAGLDTSMFFEGLMSSCDWGEGLYALPFNRSTPMFYYNKDMFEEVGLDPEKLRLRPGMNSKNMLQSFLFPTSHGDLRCPLTPGSTKHLLCSRMDGF